MSENTPTKRMLHRIDWMAAISAFTALATLIFGIYSWWDSKHEPEKKIARAIEAPKIEAAPADPKPVPTIAEAVVAKRTNQEVSRPDPYNHQLLLSNVRKFRFHRTHSLGDLHELIRAVIIAVPNHPRGAQPDFDSLVKAAKAKNTDRQLMILVPLFPVSAEDLGPGEMYWPRAWEVGGQSADASKLSTFQAMDELIGNLSDPGHFPRLERIVIIGLLSGAQFANRYAALGHPKLNPRPGKAQIHLEFAALDSMNYLYIDRNRPVAGTNRFEVPPGDTCPDFNNYRYGLEGLERYTYAVSISEETIRSNLFKRKATYFVAEGNTDTTHTDKSCPAMLQGGNVFERAQNYWNYIQRFAEWSRNVEFKCVRGRKGLSFVNLAPEIQELLFRLDPG